ncbi:related to related molecular chaperone [Ramularia collo-cygni]|uniref:Related to related molecular chaperone n=1 Tax=Ramularia collo-cygni TaxID=112498 RepID=A0A2D3VFT4_9PEZI|nr:related to related molecular chaperone [Ramularia collo-cygni]CZT24785.1 related to related molecular chaperone [Ramularia collo-cygni]
MRSQIAQQMRRAVTTTCARTPPARTPFICANCRVQVERGVPSPRAFTISSQHRQNSSDKPRIPETHYDFFPETFPQGPPPSASFSPDLRQLRKEFLQLQSKAHPDLAPPDQKRHAEALSMRINEAYKTLQDPLRRAQYLLAQRGIDVEDESAKLSESALLMEVMEAREAVDEVENEEDLVALRAENNARIENSVAVLEDAFAREDLEAAAQEAIKLRYWCNIAESIQGWEKGVGGGAIHH